MLATPCFGGLVQQRDMMSVCKLMRRPQEKGIARELALLVNGHAVEATVRWLGPRGDATLSS